MDAMQLCYFLHAYFFFFWLYVDVWCRNYWDMIGPVDMNAESSCSQSNSTCTVEYKCQVKIMGPKYIVAD